MTETWNPIGAGVLRLPSGRLVRGRALRRPLPAGPVPHYAVHLLGKEPAEVPWEARWLRWPDFRLPSDGPGPVRSVFVGPERPARHLAALSESPEYIQYTGNPPPCDAPHRTPRADPRRSTGQDLATRDILREALARAADERVEIACGGGRGRTGTALACLAVLDGVPADRSVEYVRSHYHRRAVETPWQRRYVLRFAD
ncbi:protein phosphatase [Streptomyces sp. NPDC059743]|uniref:phosphatase domain-containing protein n=1 Tax=Streptomyces sp. NPDC059743 TaxID=3346928 RepID=UPI0036650BB2